MGRPTPRHAAPPLPFPLQFLLGLFAGWVNREQQATIEYLMTEVAVLREVHGRPPRLTDAQRRRLAEKGHALGRGLLEKVAGIVTA